MNNFITDTTLGKYLQILFFAIILTSCSQNNSTTRDQKEDSISSIDTSSNVSSERSGDLSDNVSLILIRDSLYADLKLDLVEISEREFQNYRTNYKPRCALDSGRFIRGSGLYVGRTCDEICSTYLVDNASNRRLLIPSGYDAGVLRMELSPACNLLIVCSSYDGPDYENYYEDRAEIHLFNVTATGGLDGITPVARFTTKDWSIEDLTWTNDGIIALKIYEEQRNAEGSGTIYKYFKSAIKSEK